MNLKPLQCTEESLTALRRAIDTSVIDLEEATIRSNTCVSRFTLMQASKEDDAQPMIADRLRPFNPQLGAADVCVVGCGPAGLALAAELAGNGVHVALVGRQSEDICCISRFIVTILEPEASMQCSVYMSDSNVMV